MYQPAKDEIATIRPRRLFSSPEHDIDADKIKIFVTT
jgi:hypothetical protein